MSRLEFGWLWLVVVAPHRFRVSSQFRIVVGLPSLLSKISSSKGGSEQKEFQPWRCMHRDWNSTWIGSVALLAKEINVKGKRITDAQLPQGFRRSHSFLQ